MTERTKKIIFICLFILGALVLGYLLSLALFPSAQPPTTTTPTNQAPSGGLPLANVNGTPQYINVNGQLVPSASVNTTPPSGVATVATGGVTKVTTIGTTPITAMRLSSDGQNLVGYNQLDGKFYRYQADGTLVALSDRVFHNVKDITWAPDTGKVILKYPDDSTIYYNFQTQKQISLPRTWQDFDFSTDSGSLAFKSLGVDRENRWLSVAKEDGSSVKRIEELGENEAVVDVNWSPNKQVVATYTQSMDLERQRLLFIGQNSENFPSTIIEGRGYQGAWAPDGERLLYSVYADQTDLKPNLWIVTAKGEQMGAFRVNLNLQTWADKCTFGDAATIYCAVPRSLPSGAGLVREVAAGTPDDFYKIDLKTNSRALVAVPDANYSAQDLTVSSDGKTLFFTDTVTSLPQQLKLK